MSGTEPVDGRVIPEGILPRDDLSATLVAREADDWWSRLTREQRVGLWVRYG